MSPIEFRISNMDGGDGLKIWCKEYIGCVVLYWSVYTMNAH